MNLVKKYTADMVLSHLTREKTMRELTNDMGCSDRTTKTLLKELLDQHKIKRRSIGTDKRPLWMYFVKPASEQKPTDWMYKFACEHCTGEGTLGVSCNPCATLLCQKCGKPMCLLAREDDL